MHIEQLESKHLLQILNHLSLQECIALLPVCRRWKSLVESITGALDTLKIVVADIDTTENTQIDYQQQLDRFSLFHLNPAIDHHQTLTLSLSSSSISINTASLIHLIPSISHLIIYFGPVHYLHRRKKLHQMSSSTLCSLLEGWPQLRSLSLLGSISPLSTEEGVRLAGAINSLVRLRRLDSLLTSLCPLPLTRLTKTLSRLKHLSLFAYPGDISLALVRLGPSIRHLNLHQYFPMESNLILSELAPSLITCPHLTTSLTELRIKGLASAQIFPFITGHFRYLQLLDLAFDLAIKVGAILRKNTVLHNS